MKIVLTNYPKHYEDGRITGSYVCQSENGFLTTTRGKFHRKEEVSFVSHVNHDKKIVHSTTKATLNAPLLHKVLELNPNINYLIHSHEKIAKYS